MEHELISNKTIAIIGAGPAGCFCAKCLKEYGFDVTVFERNKFLQTILPTGGGRCNLSHSEFDFKELSKNYPRGEKFLYSVFSKFGVQETLNAFKKIGIETYTQEDNRIFPTSNSSKDVREKILHSIQNCKLTSEEVLRIEKLENCYKIQTNKSTYAFDNVVIATGGHSNFKILKELGINILEPTQALVGLTTEEEFKNLAGVSLKNINYKIKNKIHTGDILFTHKGISGPLIYKISSIYARKEMPYSLNFEICENFDLQKYLNENSHKEIKNLISEFIPKSFAIWLLDSLEIKPETPCHKIDGKTRDKILNKLINFEIRVTGKVADSEVVTCGGVDLKEVNSKTLESKQYTGMYFCGEILDIDGFCGGYNLQNCWSTAYIVAESIYNNYQN